MKTTQLNFFFSISIQETFLLSDSNEGLIKGCIAGDIVSQSKLYNLYSSKMLGVCMWYAKNKEEAEEVLQDGFLRVFTYISKYTGEGSFEGWIRKIMVNAALFKLKTKSFFNPVIELNTDTDMYEVPENTSVIDMIEAKDLVKLVQTLSPAYRMVFNLYVLEGMKHREIAEMLKISEGTSKSNLANARAILQRTLTRKKKKPSI